MFLIKPFCYITKKSRQKPKYFENEKNFLGEIESIFKNALKGFQLRKVVSGLIVSLYWFCWLLIIFFNISFSSYKILNTQFWIFYKSMLPALIQSFFFFRYLTPFQTRFLNISNRKSPNLPSLSYPPGI